MISTSNVGNYVIVTPVKDEERFIERTIESVIAQTVRPAMWIIVDDGSSDRTPDIIRSYADKIDWLSLVSIERGGRRTLGAAESNAFALGYELIREQGYGFVVKLDGDLLMPPDYFDQMLRRFRENEQLGIASGVYLEKRSGEWSSVSMPAYHAAGAAKMVRAECFAAIGGFLTSAGWDTADEIKAWAKGWQTTHFPELQFYHLKPEGSSLGSVRTGLLHGEVYYVCGGSKLFFLLKVMQRLLFERPFLLNGLSLLYGYLAAATTRRPRLVEPHEAAIYRRILNRRIVRGNHNYTVNGPKASKLPGKA